VAAALAAGFRLARRRPARARGRHAETDLLRGLYGIGLTSPYPQLKQYVFSRTLRETPHPAVELVADDAVARVRALKEEAGKHVWLCGGGALAYALFGEIDELILKVDPAIIGSGVPLFRGEVEPARLEVTERRSYANGFLRVRARVVYASRSGRLARSTDG
jgi:dihydrofolate reductase